MKTTETPLLKHQQNRPTTQPTSLRIASGTIVVFVVFSVNSPLIVISRSPIVELIGPLDLIQAGGPEGR